MRKEIRIGIIMILALGSVIWGVNFLKGRNFFSNTKQYIVMYGEVSGLLESNGVFIKGYKVGHVSDIKFSDRTMKHLRVSLAIESDIKLPKNSIARIVSVDLMGTKAVDLIFSDSTRYLSAGDTLIGDIEISVTKQLEPYKLQAYNLLNSMDSLSTSVHRVFNPATIKNLQEIIKNIRITSQVISTSLDNITTSLNNIELITKNLKDNNKRLTSILKNLDLLTDSLAQLRLNTSVNKLETLLDETTDMLEEVKKGKGTLGKLITNDTLYTNLNRSVLNLDTLVRDIKDNPDRYVNFSIFGKRNKK
jgi:phospholipid/cholesterol/gamma-HCH transport system substrate-binding protein